MNKQIFILGFLLLLMPEKLLADESLFNQILTAADQRNSKAPVFNRVLSSNNFRLQKQSLLALGRIGDKEAGLKIAPFLYSKQPQLRAMAAFALGITNQVTHHKALSARLKIEQNSQVQQNLIKAIGNLGNPENAISDILPFLQDTNPQVVASVCDGLTSAWTFHPDRVSVPNSTQIHRLLELSTEHAIIAQHCLFTLTRLRSQKALFDQELLLEVAHKITAVESKMLIVRIMGAMKNVKYLTFFKNVYQHSDARIKAEVTAAIAQLPYSEDKFVIIKKVASENNSLIKVSLIDNIQLTLERNNITEIVEQLLDDNSSWVSSRALLALFAVKPEQMLPKFMQYLESKDFNEQQTALNILRQYKILEPKTKFESNNLYLKILAKSNHSGIKSIASRLLENKDPDTEETVPKSKSSPAKIVYQIAGKKMQIQTSRGNINIQLLSSAPFTSANFFQLAKSGFYDGLIFHRVVPNFVVQGGDPLSTGQGGPGYSIREELYDSEHRRGSLGIATSGKDTGGSQFFFNNTDNLHLNGHYTLFARITKGLELIDLFEVGDRIITVVELD